MSAVGDRVAVISIGMSCQTAHQIHAHIDLLRHVLNDPTLQVSRFPFDWIICPPASAAAMIDEVKFFPSFSEEISCNLGAYWSEKKTIFMHEFTDQKTKSFNHSLVSDAFTSVKKKYDLLAERWMALRGVARCIFVFSNLQVNLQRISHQSGAFSPAICASDVQKIMNSVNRFFGFDQEFIILLRGDSAEIDVDIGRVHIVTDDRCGSHWTGEAETWSEIFQAYR